jgi:hypothetical protein
MLKRMKINRKEFEKALRKGDIDKGEYLSAKKRGWIL